MNYDFVISAKVKHFFILMNIYLAIGGRIYLLVDRRVPEIAIRARSCSGSTGTVENP